MPDNPDDLSDEQLEELQEKLDQDYEVGAAIKEQLVPRAVEWYTGEAAPMLDDDDDGEYGDEFDEFEE
jgi:nucleosome assembly protein 1-like 1